jgi:hypothetical protein
MTDTEVLRMCTLVMLTLEATHQKGHTPLLRYVYETMREEGATGEETVALLGTMHLSGWVCIQDGMLMLTPAGRLKARDLDTRLNRAIAAMEN